MSSAVAIRAFRSILQEQFERTGTFPNISRVMAKSKKSLFSGMSAETLRGEPVPPTLSTWARDQTADRPSPRARNADPITGRNPEQQELWQLMQTLTLAGTPNVAEFFVVALWLAMIDTAVSVTTGQVAQESSDDGSDDDMPHMGH